MTRWSFQRDRVLDIKLEYTFQGTGYVPLRECPRSLSLYLQKPLGKKEAGFLLPLEIPPSSPRVRLPRRTRFRGVNLT